MNLIEIELHRYLSTDRLTYGHSIEVDKYSRPLLVHEDHKFFFLTLKRFIINHLLITVFAFYVNGYINCIYKPHLYLGGAYLENEQLTETKFLPCGHDVTTFSCALFSRPQKGRQNKARVTLN